MTVTATGVRSASDSERRYTITCIHNADMRFATPQLQSLLSNKTPREMHAILAKPDVTVTNAKDKETMLPVVSKIDEHVKEAMQL